MILAVKVIRFYHYYFRNSSPSSLSWSTVVYYLGVLSSRHIIWSLFWHGHVADRNFTFDQDKVFRLWSTLEKDPEKQKEIFGGVNKLEKKSVIFEESCFNFKGCDHVLIKLWQLCCYQLSKNYLGHRKKLFKALSLSSLLLMLESY